MRKGYAKVSQIPKVFPDYGEGRCLYCGKELEGRQKKYCEEYHGIRYRFETSDEILVTWMEFREIILERDNKKCADCGRDAEEVHHKLPIYKEGEEFNKDNCISLCFKCHKARHKSRNTKMENGTIKQLSLFEYEG